MIASLGRWALVAVVALLCMALHPPLWLLVPQLVLLAWALLAITATVILDGPRAWRMSLERRRVNGIRSTRRPR